MQGGGFASIFTFTVILYLPRLHTFVLVCGIPVHSSTVTLSVISVFCIEFKLLNFETKYIPYVISIFCISLGSFSYHSESFYIVHCCAPCRALLMNLDLDIEIRRLIFYIGNPTTLQ